MKKNDDKNNKVVPLGKSLLIMFSIFFGVVFLIGGILYYTAGRNPFARKDAGPEISDESVNDFHFEVVLDGTWEMESPNNNDELVSFSFSGENYTMVSEMSVVVDSSYVYDKLENEEMYYDDYYGGPIEVSEVSDELTKIRVTEKGTFSYTENEIYLVSEDETVTVLPFSYDVHTIMMDEDIYFPQK